MGHTVIGLSRSEEKRRRLMELGAAATFDPNDPQWRKAAKAWLGERRVDLAIDNIGGDLLPQVIDTLGEQGAGERGGAAGGAGAAVQHGDAVFPADSAGAGWRWGRMARWMGGRRGRRSCG